MSRHRWKILAALVWLTIASGIPKAEETYPNWQSCSLDFWGNAKDLDDVRMGVSVDKLGRNVEVIHELLVDKGPFVAATTIQRVFADCVQEFANGDWSNPSVPAQAYAGCAWQNAIQLAILLRLDQGDSIASVRAIIPAPYHENAEVLNRYYGESKDKAALMAVSVTKKCIEAARKAEQ